ncbi:MAG TPA: A24 family peptidase [Candidatus Dormibacteraeota bacterium]
MIGHLLTAIGWGVVGAVVGVVIHHGSVWLARAEGLDPGLRARDVYGPPVVAALLFALLGGIMGLQWLLLLRSLWVAVLVQVIFFDLEHRLILDRVLLPAMVLALLFSIVTPHLGFGSALVTGIVAGGVFLLIALIGSVLFKAEALGFGDVKLAAFIGLLLGFPATLSALLYGVVLGGLVSIVLIVSRVRTMRDYFAYGPYIAAGALILLFEISAGTAQ